ncbi:MAG: mechanosensitive ion channel family protein, partial [Gammaproteobacteria bacterium]|nr:mechanosensitive ion channel family protein [Gammaproteobacteria bacterium]
MTLVLSYFLGRLFQRLALKLEKTSNVWDDSLLRSLRRPVIFLTWILGIGWAIDMLATGADPAFSNLVASARYVAIVTVLAYFLIRFAREVEAGFVRKGADLTTAQAIGRLARVSVIITAVLSVLQTLGVSISGALAFGGIGGIAVGFAAKDLLSNFFGGLMLYLDRPFVVGDWVRSPDREIEGTVEHIGWRLTVIRTFDQRPLYVPNSVFANISVENPSRMLNRRIYEKIGLRYADASVVKAIIDETRAFLGNQPD